MKKITQNTLVFMLLIFTSVMRLHALAEDLPSGEAKLNEAQLDELLGKIALYPDPLLAQILPASTYPLEVVQAARLIDNEKSFDKIDKQNWDPSVKAIAYYPSVTKMMNDDLIWTERLGNAVVTQQEDVMVSIQRLRKLAKEAGNLQTTKEQVVNISPNTIEIIPASPEIIYVPVYNPAVVYVTPVVRPHIPFISFIGWRIGRWLEIGLYWPSYSIYYCGPTWWYGDWHRHYHYHVRHGNVTNVTNITNVYNVKNVKNVWKHNTKRVVTHQGSKPHALHNPKNNHHSESKQHTNISQGNHNQSSQNKNTPSQSEIKKSQKHDLSKAKTLPQKDINKKQNDNLKNFKKKMAKQESQPASKSFAYKNENSSRPQHEVKYNHENRTDSIKQKQSADRAQKKSASVNRQSQKNTSSNTNSGRNPVRTSAKRSLETGKSKQRN